MATNKSETENYEQEQKNRDRIALVISIIFVLSIGFLGYRFLNNSSNVRTAIYNVQEEITNEDEDILADNSVREEETQNSESNDSTNEEQATIQNNQEAESTTQNTNNAAVQESVIQPESSQMETDKVEATVKTQWTAKNYSQGDINAGDSYTVTEGDTLWEIAEAAYGNGADWVRILDANSNSIGYLPNGQQSLITVGQTLVIPAAN